MSETAFAVGVFLLLCALAGAVAGVAWWLNARMDAIEDREREE